MVDHCNRKAKNEGGKYFLLLICYFFISVFGRLTAVVNQNRSVRRTVDPGACVEVYDDIADDCDAVRNYHPGCCKRNPGYQALIHSPPVRPVGLAQLAGRADR